MASKVVKAGVTEIMLVTGGTPRVSSAFVLATEEFGSRGLYGVPGEPADRRGPRFGERFTAGDRTVVLLADNIFESHCSAA